jgi:hypothetical protein
VALVPITKISYTSYAYKNTNLYKELE